MSDPSALIAGQVAMHAALAVDEYKADLRAQVEALQTAAAAYGGTADEAYGEATAYSNVLALFDGGPE